MLPLVKQQETKQFNICFTHNTLMTNLPLSTDKTHFAPYGLNPGLGPEQFLELQQRLKIVPNPAEEAHKHPDNVPLVTALDTNATVLHSQHSEKKIYIIIHSNIIILLFFFFFFQMEVFKFDFTQYYLIMKTRFS